MTQLSPAAATVTVPALPGDPRDAKIERLEEELFNERLAYGKLKEWASDALTFEEAIAAARGRGFAEAARVRANGNPGAAREVEAATGNICQAIEDIRTNRLLSDAAPNA